MDNNIYHKDKPFNTGLHIRPHNNSKRDFPVFEKPYPIGYFSVTTDRDYDPTAQQLHYLKLPQPDSFPLNLNKGIEQAIKKPGLDERIDFLLKFLWSNRCRLFKADNQQQPAASYRLNADFVCYRGLLRLVMCTPYERRSDWCIRATRYNGTIYLCEAKTEDKAMQIANETPQQKAFSSWGFKFEQYCLAEHPFAEPDTNAPCDECAEFNCVNMSKIRDVRLLYSAEMDGIVSETPVNLDVEPGKLPSLKFVELKTCIKLKTSQQQHTFERFKTRNWWCQSFLAGVEDIYVGFRDDKGFVSEIDCLSVREVRRLGTMKKYWDSTVCANFLLDFLKCVQKVMRDINDPYTTFIFYYNPNVPNITFEKKPGVSVDSFLPDWYIHMFDNQEALNTT